MGGPWASEPRSDRSFIPEPTDGTTADEFIASLDHSQLAKLCLTFGLSNLVERDTMFDICMRPRPHPLDNLSSHFKFGAGTSDSDP